MVVCLDYILCCLEDLNVSEVLVVSVPVASVVQPVFLLGVRIAALAEPPVKHNKCYIHYFIQALS